MSETAGMRRAIVTGAAGGLGSAIVARLLRDGLAVSGIDINAAELSVLEERMASDRFDTFAVDLASAVAISEAVEQIGSREGGVHVLVNAAGLISRRSLDELDVEEWDRVMAVNLRAPFLASKSCVRHMGPGGVIINITSTQAYVASAETLHYAVSKAGLEHLTNALAVSLGSRGIRVAAVAPGTIATSMPGHERSQAELQARYLREIPLGRLAEPDDIAGVVSFLAGADAGSITGTTIVADGGFLVQR
jgi:NAD(P)-dependent dehydrogenase (short-subunit alcohol dehydrogenase family)